MVKNLLFLIAGIIIGFLLSANLVISEEDFLGADRPETVLRYEKLAAFESQSANLDWSIAKQQQYEQLFSANDDITLLALDCRKDMCKASFSHHRDLTYSPTKLLIEKLDAIVSLQQNYSTDSTLVQYQLVTLFRPS